MLGHPRAARAVGGAMRRCPDDVPWHRVVNAAGRISRRKHAAEHADAADAARAGGCDDAAWPRGHGAARMGCGEGRASHGATPPGALARRASTATGRRRARLAGGPMKLAIHLSYSGSKVAIDMDRVLEAERLGYDSIWTAEAYGSDAVTPAAWIAARTSRIHVGTAIMQIAARTPAMTAMTAMTLDSLSGGRFRLGVGVSGPQVVEGWHGEPFGKPLAKTREYVDDHPRGAAAREAGGVPRRVLPDPVRRPGRDRARQAAEVDPPRARRHADLHRGHRTEERGADRGDRRRLDPDLLLGAADVDVPRLARRGLHARGSHRAPGSTSCRA